MYMKIECIWFHVVHLIYHTVLIKYQTIYMYIYNVYMSETKQNSKLWREKNIEVSWTGFKPAHSIVLVLAYMYVCKRQYMGHTQKHPL